MDECTPDAAMRRVVLDERWRMDECTPDSAISLVVQDECWRMDECTPDRASSLVVLDVSRSLWRRRSLSQRIPPSNGRVALPTLRWRIFIVVFARVC